MRPFVLTLLVVALAWQPAAAAVDAQPARADEQEHELEPAPAKAGEDEPAPKPWCAPELETLPGDVCFAPFAHEPDAKRTLVIFLHGLVKAGAGWQHNQMRGAARGGKRLGFSVLAPRGKKGISRHGADMVAWPTNRTAQKAHEATLLASWDEARKLIEKRQGAPFDEVFVVGFSNGAYYASSLALRGRVSVDGYALFAGGSPYQPTAKKDERAPIFVGISSKDDTAKLARKLVKLLKRERWPHRKEVRRVGHLIADKHLDHALAYLRKERSKRASRKEGSARLS